jgi:magnesium-transporting ATPase (P-type)
MITQTSLKQIETQGAWPAARTGESGAPTTGIPLRRPLSLASNLNQRLRYGPNSEAARSRRLTGILVLPFLSILVGFMLMAAILNSAAGGTLEAFTILALAVVAAIVGFFHLLKAARALDEIEYATHASDRVRKGQERKHQGLKTTSDEPNRQR